MNRLSILVLALCVACCAPEASPEAPTDPPVPVEPNIQREPCEYEDAPERGEDGLTFEQRLQILASYGAWLAETLPPDAPVYVGFDSLPDAYGYTTWRSDLGDEGSYLIVLDETMLIGAMLETLAHEWAHALVWDVVAETGQSDHGPAWGLGYSRTYEALLAWAEATFE